MNQIITRPSRTDTYQGLTPEKLQVTPQNKKSRTTAFSRAALIRGLAGLRHGSLTLIEGSDVRVFGNQSEEEINATVTVHTPEFFRRLFFGGSLGAAESYLQGQWSCDNLTNVLQLFARNLAISNHIDSGLSRIAKVLARGYHAMRENSITGARRNIHEHYDLGNSFFSLFLDETMMYSSAIFDQPEMSLTEASTAKLKTICNKINLQSSDHVLEIGTGWGGFAEYAARNYGCRVTTTTISHEQYEFSRDRIRKSGLNDQVTLLKKDYRDLRGQFDKIVSIEMIEAVGYKYFDAFFKKCGELLKPDGLMLLQGITMPEQRYREYLKSVDFIQRYIFPGGCLPSVLAMGESVGSHTDMRILHLEDFAPHYARTLQLWRERFFERIEDVRNLGFSERFFRMWEYYFCYSEAAFLERLTGVVQLVLAKPGCRFDLVRSRLG